MPSDVGQEGRGKLSFVGQTEMSFIRPSSATSQKSVPPDFALAKTDQGLERCHSALIVPARLIRPRP